MKYKRLRPRGTRNPTKDIQVTHGVEGPREDGYGFTEYKGMSLDGKYLVTFHFGPLSVYLKLTNDREKTIVTDAELYSLYAPRTKNRKGFNALLKKTHRILQKRFERLVGTSVRDIRWHDVMVQLARLENGDPDDAIYGGP
jgi:hypothetical protein